MAADIYKFVVIIAGLTILFTLSGMETGIGLLLEKSGVDIVKNPQNIALSNLSSTLIAVLVAAGVGGIAIGFITKTSPVNFLLVGYATLLISFVADIVVIANYAFSLQVWAGWVVLAILTPLAFGYLHSVISWWGDKA